MLKFNFKDEIPEGGNRLYNLIDKITGGIIQQNCMIQRSNKNDQDGTPINALLMQQIADEINNNTPVGVIHEYAGAVAPSGWLLCQGQAISRTTYADLFKIIGTTYGTGDGSTTFNVPDMRGRVTVGLNGNDTAFNSLGKQGGSKDLQSHTHTGSSDNAGSHGHTAKSDSKGAHTHTVSGTAASAGDHQHNIRFRSNATNGAYYANPPLTSNSGTPFDNANPTPIFSAGAHTHTVSGTAASAGAHSHTITVNSGGSHSHTITINASGSGDSGNLQPYTVMNYIIKY